MPWAWIAIRLTAFSLLSEPSFSTTEPAGSPRRALARDLDGDEIAVNGAAGTFARNRQFAAELLLVDRDEPAAAIRQTAKDAEHAVLGAVEQLDDAAVDIVAGAFDAQQRAVADARHLAGPRTPLRGDANDRRRAVRVFVPFGRARQAARRRCHGR